MDNYETINKRLDEIHKEISALKYELGILENESYELELKLWFKDRIKCDRCAKLDCQQRNRKVDCKMFSPKEKY